MASKRVLIQVLTRSSRACPPAFSPTRPRLIHTLPPAPLRPQNAPIKPTHGQIRWSSSSPASKKYNFEELQSRLPTSSSPSHLTIIDVRETAEVTSTGKIPGAHNIPISSAPDGLFLPAEEFAERWGFEKPERGDEVVFYCRSGVRSRAAAGMVGQMEGGGWEGVRVGEYPGSWMAR